MKNQISSLKSNIKIAHYERIIAHKSYMDAKAVYDVAVSNEKIAYVNASRFTEGLSL